MALIVYFEFAKPGLIRGRRLFGNPNGVRISKLSLGIVTIIRILDAGGSEKIREFLESNLALPQFMATHEHEMAAAMLQFESQARIDAEERARAKVDYWKDSYLEQYERVDDLQRQVHALTTTVHTQADLIAGARPAPRTEADADA